MSLELAAKHLASRGRKGDSMLVHMAPEEVSGLQALARAGGGTLTLNPDTGLPEANFLKRMLPMIIGAGLAATGVGAPMAAMMVGGGYGAATGDLRKGLMAGLSAYGGAGLAGGLSAAAGTAAPGATAATAPVEGLTGAVAPAESLAGAASQGAGVSVTPFGAEAANLSQTGPNLFGGGSYLGPSQGAEALNIGLPPATPPVAMTPAAVPPPAAMPADFGAVETVTPPQSAFSRMKSGLQALNTPEGREAFIGKAASKGVEATGVGGYGGLAKYGLAAMSPAMMGGEAAQYAGSGPNPFRYNYEQSMPEGPNMEGSSEALQYQGRYVPYADGGPVEEMSNRNQMQTMMANGGQMFARGGISHLGDYSDGGRLLKGPGDGVSDSIPATIANKRPARLADGEFVVPARIVSELGNGSTEAGARKLYAMMDRVQKARKKSIGENKVAVNSRAAKLLPA
jgi:hypothetical protein